MKRTVVAGVIGLALLAPLPAGAITYGVNDNGRHPNVASIVGEVDGQRYQWCTGTLIEEDVVVTASHCFAGFDDVTFSVTFDDVIDANKDGFVDDDVTLHGGTPVTNPRYASGGANNTYDVAVFLLDEPVGIEPASLPTAGLLDERSTRSSRFTTVGYGTVRETKRKAQQSLLLGTRRMVATQSINSVTKSWVTFSMNVSTGNGGTCYGDSGGPHFLGAGSGETDIVTAVTVTGDAWCKATDKDYRLDTASARDFLGDYVDVP